MKWCQSWGKVNGSSPLKTQWPELPSLSEEVYPAPGESQNPYAVLYPERLARIQAKLLEILPDLGHPRTIWIYLRPPPHCGDNICHPIELTIVCCFVPAQLVSSMKSFVLGTWKLKSRTWVHHKGKTDLWFQICLV